MEANYNQQGYTIKQRNSKYNFLVVEDPATTRAVRTAEAQAAAATSRQAGARLVNETLISASRSSLLHARSGSKLPQTGAVRGPIPPQSAAFRQSIPSAAVKAISKAKVRLSKIPGVAAVQYTPRVRLLGRTPGDKNAWPSTSGASKASRQLQSTPACAADTLDSYTEVYPDLTVGRSTEDAPYGVSMLQADDPMLVQIGSTYQSKVMFCVLDTGMDPTNPEFDTGETVAWEDSLGLCHVGINLL